MTSDHIASNWRKSTKSNGTGSCVEAASSTDAVAVRDTTNRNGGTLTFTTTAWRAFTNELK